MSDKVKVIRVLEYIGNREWVEDTLQRSSVPMNGVHLTSPKHGNIISSCLINNFPSILTEKECVKLDTIPKNIRYAKDGLVQAMEILKKNNYDKIYHDDICAISVIIKHIENEEVIKSRLIIK